MSNDLGVSRLPREPRPPRKRAVLFLFSYFALSPFATSDTARKGRHTHKRCFTCRRRSAANPQRYCFLSFLLVSFPFPFPSISRPPLSCPLFAVSSSPRAFDVVNYLVSITLCGVAECGIESSKTGVRYDTTANRRATRLRFKMTGGVRASGRCTP